MPTILLWIVLAALVLLYVVKVARAFEREVQDIRRHRRGLKEQTLASDVASVANDVANGSKRLHDYHFVSAYAVLGLPPWSSAQVDYTRIDTDMAQTNDHFGPHLYLNHFAVPVRDVLRSAHEGTST